MIPIRSELSACDHCGACCRTAPCLLASADEVQRISAFVGYDVRRHINIESGDGLPPQVRISANGKPCVFHVDGRCAIEPVKPKGGRDFECWTPATYRMTYFWSPAELQRIGYRGSIARAA